MKSIFLVVLLAAAAVSNAVPDVVEMPDVGDRDEMADLDLIEMPEVFVTDVDELVDVTDLTDNAEEAAVASRCNLNQGSIGSSDVLLFNAEHRANPVASHVHLREITVRTNLQITAIRVTCIGTPQNATPSIVSGGVGYNFVTIRIQSATGRGFHYSIQVYGR